MKPSRSFNGKYKLKELFLSKDSFLLEDDELYQLIKKDFHEKQTHTALTFVKPYLHIIYSYNKKDNLYNQMLKETSEKKVKMHHSFSHFRIVDKPNLFPKKLKKSFKYKNRNNIPNHNNKIKTKILSKSIDITNKKQNFNNINIINTYTSNKSILKRKIKNKSLSFQNYSINPTKKEKMDSYSYNSLNKKISLDKLLSLRSRFFANKKMNRGELTEMMFGNEIPFYQNNSIHEDMQNKVYEVLCNNPKLIIDLIEKGYVDKKDVIDYFNIKSINISWNEELEKKFREISYNKRKTNSNMLKTTFFLVNIGFHRILKQKFEEKNYRNTNTYDQAEIEEFSKIYEKLRKYDINKLLEGYSKVDAIYHLREVIINDKINEIRDKYYHKKLNKFFHDKNKSDIIVQKVVEKEKNEMKEMKNYIFQIRENKEWKVFPYKNINKLRFSKSITKINKLIKEEINTKNVYISDKIKQSKKYIKEKIKLYQKQGIFPTITSSKKFIFDWKQFMKDSHENKRIIEYCIIMIQSKFRGFMVKAFLAKIIRSVDIIVNNLDRYLSFKKLVLKLYKISFNEIVFCKNENLDYKNKVKDIRKFIKFIIRNNKSRKLLFKKDEIDLINKLEGSNIGFRPIREEQPIYSIKLLLILDKFLFYLYHGYI